MKWPNSSISTILLQPLSLISSFDFVALKSPPTIHSSGANLFFQFINSNHNSLLSTNMHYEYMLSK